MSNISDFSFSFSLVRNYVVFTFKRFYSEYIVIGRENIPIDCPVIFAPNHINALMDAIAVHSIAPKGLPVIFLARADVFNNKTAITFLKFVKILPAFRMRDGLENLSKNNKVFEQCVEILHQNKALGIMPEGNQGEQKKIRPLLKGIFRIAFDAQHKSDNAAKVKIIPVGIEYGSLVKYGKHIIINIGKPIEVSEYMNSYAVNPVTATNEIRENLRNALATLSLNLASESHYECFETATEVANKDYLEKLKLADNTVNGFVARQEIAKRLVFIEKNDPEKTKRLETLCKEYTNYLQYLNLKSWVFKQESDTTNATLIEALKLFCTLPIFLLGLILNFLPFFIPVLVRKYVMKTEYEGFFSSLQFVIGIITFPLFYILQTVLFYTVTNSSWLAVLLLLILQYPLGRCAIKWNSVFKKFITKIRLRKLKQKKSFELLQVQNVREQIIRMISFD